MRRSREGPRLTEVLLFLFARPNRHNAASWHLE
jgi:hypothetical protein